MTAFLALWSHLLAAALYGALTIFQLRRWNGDPLNRPLVSAFAATSVWAIFLSMLDPYAMVTQLAEAARNLTFLAFLYGVTQEAEQTSSQRAVKGVYAAVAAVVGLQIVIGGLMSEFRAVPVVLQTLASTSHILGLTMAAGSLILVHNLYGQATPTSRGALRLPMIALAAMWAYDLHLYTVAYFSRGMATELFAMRGLILALLAPLFAMAVRQHASWKIQISRAATFQSISVFIILLYLIGMMSASRATEIVGGDWMRLGQIGAVVVMTVAALVLLPSARARGWLGVFLAKHLFEHRYDYRQEWLRFTDTIGRDGSDSTLLEERVVKALADIAGSPGGILLLVDGQYRLSPEASWNSECSIAPSSEGAEALMRFVEAESFVLDFGALQSGWLIHDGKKIAVPQWLVGLERAWAGIPLIHSGKLVALVVLERATLRRALDWEDFDLFRAAGIQAASYIAEARGQQALADARRFDEFNRRFAFIMHDLKNLVSQLSLVARNSERHAENPEFRADMIATLQSSVRKMNDLLARLSPGAVREADPPRSVLLEPLIERVAAAKRRAHPIEVDGDNSLVAMADPNALEQALAHLVQNAIDASEPTRPVVIRYFESGGDAAIEVADRGRGMSEEFIRTRLFQPFASTKETGFGIGAFEARSLLTAMGGRLDVESAEGAGTRFTLFLPSADTQPATHFERMRA